MYLYLYVYMYNPNGLIRGLMFLRAIWETNFRAEVCFLKTNFCTEVCSVFLVDFVGLHFFRFSVSTTFFDLGSSFFLKMLSMFLFFWGACIFSFFAPQHFLISDLRFSSQNPGELAKKGTENPNNISCSSLWLNRKSGGTRKIKHEKPK